MAGLSVLTRDGIATPPPTSSGAYLGGARAAARNDRLRVAMTEISRLVNQVDLVVRDLINVKVQE